MLSLWDFWAEPLTGEPFRSIQTVVHAQAGEGLRELSEVLWREREQLELVLFKLEEQRLLLVDGQTRWVCHASREVEVVLDQLSQVELTRAVVSAIAACELGLLEDASLRALAAAAGDPWPSVLQRHVGALDRLAGKILVLAGVNRALLTENLVELRAVMKTRPRRPTTRMLVDVAAFQSALATNQRLLHPSLVDAVRGQSGTPLG